jgi:hypothetical protein
LHVTSIAGDQSELQHIEPTIRRQIPWYKASQHPPSTFEASVQNPTTICIDDPIDLLSQDSPKTVEVRLEASTAVEVEVLLLVWIALFNVGC